MLTVNIINEAQLLLKDVEIAAGKFGLHLNAKKTTKVLIYNLAEVDILSHSGEKIKIVNDFKYLGSYDVSDSEKYTKCRKAKVWTACNKLSKNMEIQLEPQP